GGDVKLMAAAGLILGWKLIILAFVWACILGSVLHIIRMKISHAPHVLAMGPYLSMGIFLAALWGEPFINWYLNMILR
ncbi:MAG: prepilin peptidase, partial [Lachnospiraceae bacterium]